MYIKIGLKWVAAALGAICGYNLFEAGENKGEQQGRVEGYMNGFNDGLEAEHIKFELESTDNQEVDTKSKEVVH